MSGLVELRPTGRIALGVGFTWPVEGALRERDGFRVRMLRSVVDRRRPGGTQAAPERRTDECGRSSEAVFRNTMRGWRTE